MFKAETKGITVIADDLTGAAEIAGMAPEGTVVIAANTRSMAEDEARAETLRIVKHCALNRADVIFKKTDSALRGHIVAELKTLMQELGYERCLLLPQNPSKGRVIKAGKYLIGGVPLHETPFCYDPEFPAVSSDVLAILQDAYYLPLDGEMQDGINIAEATTEDEIKLQVAKADENTLFAGAADLFSVIFSDSSRSKNGMVELRDFSSVTIVQGSTLSQDLSQTPFFRKNNIRICPMPDDVFDGADRTDWADEGNICMTVPQKRSNPVWCKTIMAKTVCRKFGVEESKNGLSAVEIVHSGSVQHLVKSDRLLVIEGGATAFAVLTALNWSRLELVGQIVPGVVALKHENAVVVLKPGSYPWGNMFAD